MFHGHVKFCLLRNWAPNVSSNTPILLLCHSLLLLPARGLQTQPTMNSWVQRSPHPAKQDFYSSPTRPGSLLTVVHSGLQDLTRTSASGKVLAGTPVIPPPPLPFTLQFRGKPHPLPPVSKEGTFPLPCKVTSSLASTSFLFALFLSCAWIIFLKSFPLSSCYQK